MEIYIEIIILEQLILHFLCYISATILLNEFLLKKTLFIHTTAMLLISFNIYINIPTLLIYVYIFIIHLILFRKKALRFYFSYMISYFVFIFTLLHLNSYSMFSHGLYIVFKHYLYNLILLLVIFVFYFIHTYFLKRSLVLKQLCYSIEFTYNFQNYKFDAFLDTGNEAMYLGKPIIFLKQECLNVEPDLYTDIYGINGIDTIPLIYLHKILINQIEYKDIYIGLVNTLKHECDALLNITLLYEGE